MTIFIISADVHGSLSTWITLKEMAGKSKHGLVVAGDLFDDRYGRFSDPDFSPEEIKEDISRFKNPFYYVYGNCDTASFFPGASHCLSFHCNDTPVFLHHGHRPDLKIPKETRIIIQGHTHLSSLEEKNGIIHLNPGSLTASRNGLSTYGMITRERVCLMDIAGGKVLSAIDI